MMPTPFVERLSAKMRGPRKGTTSDYVALAIIGLVILYAVWKIIS
jgi:hypothetical protein